MRTPRASPVVLSLGLLVACAPGEQPEPDGFAVGDVIDREESTTAPVVPETVQFTDDGTTVAATCGATVCRRPATGGAVDVGGAGGDALDLGAGVALEHAGAQVLVVDVATGEVRATFEGHPPPGDTAPIAPSLTLSPDGGLAATAGHGGAWLWRTADGAVVRRLDTPSADSRWSAVFDAAGERVAVGWSEGIREEAVDQQRVVAVGERVGLATGVLAAPAGLASAEAWSPDGAWLVGRTDTGELGVWETDDYTLVATSGVPATGPVAVSADAGTVAFVDPDDETTVRLWSLPGTTGGDGGAGGDVADLLTDHPDRVTGLVFSPGGARLATASTAPFGDGVPEPGASPGEVQVHTLAGPGGGDVVRLAPPSDTPSETP